MWTARTKVDGLDSRLLSLTELSDFHREGLLRASRSIRQISPGTFGQMWKVINKVDGQLKKDGSEKKS